MLNVNCGASGIVRVVKENSITGEITHDSTFNNIWTDEGLAYLRNDSSKTISYPGGLSYGNGAHTGAHNSVTELAGYLDTGSASVSGNNVVANDGTICTITRTTKTTVPARGVDWTISELGLSDSFYKKVPILTYTLTKNALGVPTPIPVKDFEIVTIYYTIQLQYPMSLPPIGINVEGMPPTTATFTLKPGGPRFGDYLNQGDSNDKQYGYTSSNFAGGVESDYVSGDGWQYWAITSMNRTTTHIGSNGSGISHLWELNPPLVKDDTQTFRFRSVWTYTNVAPIKE